MGEATDRLALARAQLWEDWRSWALFPAPGTWLFYMRSQPMFTPYVLSHYRPLMSWFLGVNYCPILERLTRTNQDPIHHPEGDAFTHTCLTVQRAAEIAERDNLNPDERVVLVFAALCHDFGKPQTTALRLQGTGERLTSYGHDKVGAELAAGFLQDIGCPEVYADQIVKLVRHHMWIAKTHPGQEGRIDLSRAIRRLARRLEPVTIEQWGRLVEADHAARPPLPSTNPAAPIVAKWRAMQEEE